MIYGEGFERLRKNLDNELIQKRALGDIFEELNWRFMNIFTDSKDESITETEKCKKAVLICGYVVYNELSCIFSLSKASKTAWSLTKLSVADFCRR